MCTWVVEGLVIVSLVRSEIVEVHGIVGEVVQCVDRLYLRLETL